MIKTRVFVGVNFTHIKFLVLKQGFWGFGDLLIRLIRSKKQKLRLSEF